MGKKINWKEVRHCDKAWTHVKTDLTGNLDHGTCTVCKQHVVLEQEGRSRDSILREFTRKHFYKHKRNAEPWAVALTAPLPPDSIPLFV